MKHYFVYICSGHVFTLFTWFTLSVIDIIACMSFVIQKFVKKGGGLDYRYDGLILRQVLVHGIRASRIVLV